VRRLALVLILGGIAAGAFSWPAAGAGAAPDLPRVAPGEVVVIGREAAAKAALSGPTAAGTWKERARGVGVSVTSVKPVVPAGAAGGRSAFPGGAWILRYDGADSPEAVARRLAADPAVAYAGPNHLLRVTGDGADVSPSRAEAPLEGAPDDSLYAHEWWLPAMHVPQAWNRTRGAGVLIAVIDTGVELTHPDLVERIAVNDAERDGVPGVDDDGNGYVDDVLGYDFTDAPGLPGAGDYLVRDPDPTDDFGHGTSVAGAAAATRNNRVGLAGVAPEAEILAVRAGFRTTLPFLPAILQEDDAAAAVIYAADRGARILNLSWGDVVDAPLIRAAVAYATARGALVVASAGNTPGDTAFYPAAYPEVLSIGAIGTDFRRANFSTWGQDLDLLAPGASILTTALGGEYATTGGTSLSAPMVSGAAALAWSAHPSWSADEIAWRLRLTAAAAARGWTREDGWGLADAGAAVANAQPPPQVAFTGVERPPDGIRFAGTVSAASLHRWTLSVLPEASAKSTPLGDPGGALPAERVLVEGSSRQVVAESLGVFVPAAGDTGAWVARLRASVGSALLLEKRVRFRVSPAPLSIVDPVVELQASPERSWDAVGTWRSATPYQGSLRLVVGGDVVRTAREVSVGTHHAVRLMGPIPIVTAEVRFLGRPEGSGEDGLLATRAIDVPPALRTVEAAGSVRTPPGSPMERAVDWDGDGLPEFLVEAPPAGGDLYGFVRRFEWTGSTLPPAAVDSSAGLFTGIPVDAADADGDGSAELVIYRLDGWSVWEAGGPGGFPDRLIHQTETDEGVPVGYVDTPEGVRLLAVEENRLRVFRSDPDQGYVLTADVAGTGGRLSSRGASADLDGDGRPEAVFPDENGDLVLFRLTPDGAASLGRTSPPGPGIVAATVIPRAGGPRPALVTVEIDPATPEVEGDLTRGAVRLRRWEWTSLGPLPGASLAFAGLTAASDLELLAWPSAGGAVDDSARVILRRGNRYDAARLEGGGLLWEPLFTSVLDRVQGTGLYPRGIRVGGRTAIPLWAGASTGAETPGEETLLVPGDPVEVSGAPLRVERIEPAGTGLRLVVGWEDDGCAPPGTVYRSSTADGFRAIPVPAGTRSVTDTVSLGAQVRYETLLADCERSPAVLTANEPQEPEPTWLDPGRLSITLDPPLASGPGEVRLRVDGRWVPPDAVDVDRGGSRILVTFTGVTPDSLEVSRAWDTDGLPVGGAIRSALRVPPPPADARPPVLATVAYRSDGEGPRLEVTLGGGPFRPTCPEPFRLSPVGESLSYQDTPEEGAVRVPLAAPLAPGSYTLSLVPECLSTAAAGPGRERRFLVGFAVYPNPVHPGADLTVENAVPGMRLRLLDVSGRERWTWRVESGVDRRPMGDTAPGLYLLRIEDPAGRFQEVLKLVVLR
jgi:hypothetical protein